MQVRIVFFVDAENKDTNNNSVQRATSTIRVFVNDEEISDAKTTLTGEEKYKVTLKSEGGHPLGARCHLSA